MDVNVYKIDCSYLNELQTISKQTFLETYSEVNTEENMNTYVSKNFSLKQLSNDLNNNNAEFYFVRIKKEIIGYLKLNFEGAQTQKGNKNSVEIERIYVLKDFQGKKFGQVLFNKALEVAKNKNAQYIWLGVWEKNLKAIQFYEKIGFVVYTTHTFILGNDRQTDKMMKLLL